MYDQFKWKVSSNHCMSSVSAVYFPWTPHFVTTNIACEHDDVIKCKDSALLASCAGNSLLNIYMSGWWWRHQMETFSALLALWAGNSPVTGEFPSQNASDMELWCFLSICALINGWVNNREAVDLRRHRAHYDVTIMIYFMIVAQQRNYCLSIQKSIGIPIHNS